MITAEVEPVDRRPDGAGPRRRRAEHAVAGLLLLGLLALLHHDVVFQGRSLVLTNHSNPLDYRFLPENYGPDLVPPERWFGRNLLPFANIADPGAGWWQWEPGGEFLERAIQLGEWPFWDPYIGGGTPAMANLVSGFLFPPYAAMVVTVGHSARTETLYLLLLIWATSYFGYLFVRAHGLTFTASVAGGAAIMVSGAVNQQIGTLMGQAACTLTPVLYVTRLQLNRPTLRRTILLALTYAAAALASFPPILVAVFGLAALYSTTVIAAGDVGGSRGHAAVSWSGAVALSIGLVSFYYLPAALLTALPQLQSAYAAAGLQSLPAIDAYQLLSPTLAGGAPIYVTPAFPTEESPYVAYAGITLLITAALAGRGNRRRERCLFVFSALACVLILMKLFGLPPVQWVGWLPGFRFIHFAHYLGVPLGFVIALLSALGVERLVRRTISLPRLLLVTALALLAVEGLWRVGERHGVQQAATAADWVRDWKVLAVVTCAAVLGILLAALRGAGSRQRGVAWVLLAAAFLAESLYNNAYLSPDIWDVFDHPPPYVQFLVEHDDFRRVLTFGAPTANLNSAFEIATMDSLMAFNPPRAHALYARYSVGQASAFMREARRVPPEPVLDRENIGLIAVRNDFADLVGQIQERGHPRVFDDGYVSVFERPTAPRFFFSSEYMLAAGTSGLDAVATAQPGEVVLEQSPGFPSALNPPDDPAVRVAHYGRNTVVLDIAAPRAGLVVASENFFDGWTVLVNGQPAPLLAGNYAFRAVPVGPGLARVEFRYWPPGLTAGLALSGISFAVLALLPFIAAVRRRSVPGP